MNIPHLGHCRWVHFHFFGTTTVYQMRPFTKWTRRAVRLEARPSNSSPGKSTSLVTLVNYFWYVQGSFWGVGGEVTPRSTFLTPCWTWWWVARNPAARSTYHSGHIIHVCIHYLFVRPSPIIWSPQASAKTCSVKFCDNFLVQVELFYHFRGLIFCNVKVPQFQLNKKQQRRGTFQ